LRRGLACAAVFAAAAFAASGVARADDEKTVWRLFVADQATPTVTAIDLGTDARWTFELTGPSRLYPTPSGEAVIAVQSDHDAVHVLKSGVKVSAHDGHADIDVTAPSRIDGVIEGPRPFHLVAHDDVVAINFDRGGYVTLLDGHDVLDGDFDGAKFEQNRAHHGFAVPMGGAMVSSVASDEPTEDDALPKRVGIRAYGKDGSPLGEMAVCTDLHGEAFSGHTLVAGCKEGVVAAREAEGGVEFTMLPYPEDFPEGHTGTLLGARSIEMFLGNYGRDSVVIIDPSEAPYFTRVELPFRRVDFVLDPARPQHAFILTEDGTLHRLNMLSAEIEASATVTEPYSMDGHWRDPRPRLAMAGESVVLTDPRASLVRVVDAASLTETGTVPVDGLPYNIAVIGGGGLTH